MVSMILLLALSPLAEAPAQARKPDVVLQWNETALNTIRAEKTAPPLAARNLAMVHAAMYDAVNAIQRTHRAYYVNTEAAGDTSPEAAAAVAAHRTLVTLYPKQVSRFDAMLDDCLDAIPESEAKARGIRLGQHVAEKILAWRSQDGAATEVRYTPGTSTGLWQPTPPDFRPALLPQWPSCKCFAMSSGAQFRAPGVPALSSAAYTSAYNEVKDLGAAEGSRRTKEQTDIAYFWADGDSTVTPPGHWNQIAQTVAKERGLTLAENARLFALLNITLADAGIACWDSKFKHQFWRPIQAIRRAAEVDNPNTGPDRAWTPLLPTPPFPTYTSGHSTFSGSAAALLASYFGSDEMRFSTKSDGLPNVTRSFTRFSDAAAEAGKSRIYGGIHYEFDNADGLAAGRAVADYVFRNFLVPRQTSAMQD